MLLHARLSLEGAGGDHGRIMIVVTGEIGDRHRRIRKKPPGSVSRSRSRTLPSGIPSVRRRQLGIGHIAGEPGFVRALGERRCSLHPPRRWQFYLLRSARANGGNPGLAASRNTRSASVAGRANRYRPDPRRSRMELRRRCRRGQSARPFLRPSPFPSARPAVRHPKRRGPCPAFRIRSGHGRNLRGVSPPRDRPQARHHFLFPSISRR